TGVKATSKKKATVSLVWSKKSNVSGYKIQYSQNKNFASAKSKKVGKKTSQLDLTKLKSGKTYYIRICAYKKNSTTAKSVYYKYSTVKKIKVK
ncbi:MAG: fibronectin type III domain-containing protein, partial [Lachnospiraceae bacterium]|nr:fibronectin type III domain-containing protein [Lachnospiraceae bacterium]